MDSKLLFFPSPKMPPSIPPPPSFLSYCYYSSSYSSSFCFRKSSSLGPMATLWLPCRKPFEEGRTPFLGKDLAFTLSESELGLGGWTTRRHRRPALQPVTAVVKRRKEVPFDNVIQRDKKLKLVLKIRKILVSQPDRTMNMKELGKFRRELGLTRKRRFIALLRRFPGVFEVVEEGVYSLKFRMTSEAERLYLEELSLRNEMEDALVVKLRKLLMMSLEKRILLEKIAHLKTDLGLPLDFRSTICERYPQYFRVVETDHGPALELTQWDPALAVSAAEVREEENRIKEMEERNLIIDRHLKFRRVKLPKGLNLSKGEMRRISQFRDMPYISPYSDFSQLKSGTLEKEKHACGVVHELLSLTFEKRTLVDHLTHFREEFKFSQQLRGMLIRHPDMFYVSLKGDRDSVFLREAYHDSQLIEKDKLSVVKEKMRALVAIPRFPRRSVTKTDDDQVDGSAPEDDSGEDDLGQWSDAEGSYDEFNENDENIDDDDDVDGEDEDNEDYWTDEDDSTPPDFDIDETLSLGPSRNARPTEILRGKEDKVLVPTHPDGRPRERW